jgi:hypothetical protein
VKKAEGPVEEDDGKRCEEDKMDENVGGATLPVSFCSIAMAACLTRRMAALTAVWSP